MQVSSYSMGTDFIKMHSPFVSAVCNADKEQAGLEAAEYSFNPALSKV